MIRVIKIIAVLQLIVSFFVGMAFDFYSEDIGGRASSGYIKSNEYYVGFDGEYVKVSIDIWNKAVLYENIWYVFFILAVLSILFLAYRFFLVSHYQYYKNKLLTIFKIIK